MSFAAVRKITNYAKLEVKIRFIIILFFLFIFFFLSFIRVNSKHG